MKTINENTPITISLLVIMLGGVAWITTLYAKTVSTSEAISKIESKSDQYQKTVDEINLRLTRIEGMIGRRPDPFK